MRKSFLERPEKIAEAISFEAKKRIAGREEILRRLGELAESAAREYSAQIKKISIRPAWSHEYDERTGVVVDVEAIASDDPLRFLGSAE